MPACACLASRIPYGKEITARKLTQVNAVEKALEERGLMPARARHHGDTVRIELAPEIDPGILLAPKNRQAVVNLAKKAGFRYVVLDLEPYRSGRLNDVLSDPPGARISNGG
jgi:uncharacterized protein